MVPYYGMKKAIVLALVLAFGAIPILSKAFTVEEIQTVIKETVDTPSLTESTNVALNASTTVATSTELTATSTISASSTLSITSSTTLIVVPEKKSNEVTLNIEKKTVKKILSFFGWSK